MSKKVITIATRESPLAMWQAEHVKARLEALSDDLTVNLLSMKTKGDKWLEAPLAKVGGKGLFIKELEAALLEGRADIAVHSMKDVTMTFPQGLALAAILERENPYDAFVSNQFDSFESLPEGAVVGTSSLRRQCQLMAARPDLQIKLLRGNVNTRLRKLDDGEYDAIILACAGLLRLDMADRIKHQMSPTLMLPSAGQGAVGIECRSDDKETIGWIEKLACKQTTYRVVAEREINTRLGGGCQVPIASFATLKEDTLHLIGRVATVDGKTLLESEITGPVSEASELGQKVAQALIAQGAQEILDEIYQENND